MKKIIENNKIRDEMVSVSRLEYETLKEQNAELSGQVKWLMEQMRLARQKRFGATSEKSGTNVPVIKALMPKPVIGNRAFASNDVQLDAKKHGGLAEADLYEAA